MSERLVLACDPARYGPDETVTAIRRGRRLERLVRWRKCATTTSCEKLMALVHEVGGRGPKREQWVQQDERTLVLTERAPALERVEVVCDVVGIGSGLVDQLRKEGVWVTEFNGGAQAWKQPQRFANLRTEAAWYVRRQLEQGNIDVAPDAKLEEELTATRWREGADGRLALEPKEDIRARLGRSPDAFDAVCMAFALDLRRRFTWLEHDD